MNYILRYIWFGLFVRIVVLLVLGLNIRNRSNLYKHKQMILVVNHNSHLDTMVLMTLFPFRKLKNIRPVAATDYFLNNCLLNWFATKIIRIVPISRKLDSVRTDPLASCKQALDEGCSLILYPEGTRGEPEKLNEFKAGISHLVRAYPKLPVVPVFCHGLGKALPRGEFLLVPFYCDIFVGEEFYWQGSKAEFMETLNNSMRNLAEQGNFMPWD